MTTYRDRVTAILTLADKAEPPEPWNLRSFHRDVRWLAELALEALDAIDKARALHYLHVTAERAKCGQCMYPWPCPTWQALNGGNESGDDRHPKPKFPDPAGGGCTSGPMA